MMSKRVFRFGFWQVVVALILASGLAASILRFWKGLGASTNLSDQFPWGIWIAFDVMVGVGLAAGGFTIAAVVHIFHLEKYESISRPSLLTAFLGYLLVIVGLVFDIGRPLRLWHPLVMWNPHSVMFEVAWCVMLYTTVLALEFSPIVFERFNLKLPLKVVRTLYMPLVLAGVILSTLHQSSLGTLFVIVPDKLHGLWYSPLLPAFFFISAIGAGLAMTIFESFLSFRAFGKELEKDVLKGLARVTVVILAVYLTFRFQDLARRGNLGLAFQLNVQSTMFWCEVGLGAILPMVLFAVPWVRNRTTGLFFGSLLVVMGFVVGRLNVALTGMLHSETYFPKWSELMVTISIVTLGFVIFGWVVHRFPVFGEGEASRAANHTGFESPIGWKVVTSMWVLVLAAAGTLGYAMVQQGALAEEPSYPPERKVRLDSSDLPALPAPRVMTQSEDSPGPVTFDHELHVGLQDTPSCRTCHPAPYRFGLEDAPPVPHEEEWMHSEESCGKCHNGDDAFAVDDTCEDCHADS